MMRALDLFCGAGGVTKGLQRAGFHVTGVDIAKQPRYCGEVFHQADAMTFKFSSTAEWVGTDTNCTIEPCEGCGLERKLHFDFIWASPPCQKYSAGAAKWGTSEDHPHLIPGTRSRLKKSGAPFVIENIVPAMQHLVTPVMLCGTMFDLGVFRHLLFECSFDIAVPVHFAHVGKIGDGKYHTVTGHAGGSSKRDGWKNGGVADRDGY